MPNRILKDSLCTSEKISSLSDFEFRVWTGLILMADDAGRGDARAAIIKGRVFPLRERVTVKDITSAVHGLAGKGCIILYEVDGKSYFYFPTWSEHQRVRDVKPKYPPPPDNFDVSQQSAAICGNLRQSAAIIQSNPNPIQSESKGESAHTREEAADKPPRSPKFRPPTVAEVAEYCKERGNSVDAQRFCDFYASKGWRVGSQPMKDWKAAVRTWERREGVKQRSEKPAAEPERPKPTAAEMERLQKIRKMVSG